MTQSIVLAVIEISGVILIGTLARMVGYIRTEDLARLSKFVIDFLFAALTFSSIVNDFEAERLNELWPLPVLGLGMVIAGWLLGIFLKIPLRKNGHDLGKTFHHLCAINNYGFLPIIVLGRMWGDTAIANLFFYNLGTSVGFWTIGVALLQSSDKSTIPESSRPNLFTSMYKTGVNLMTPSLVALFLALGLSVTGWKVFLPEVFVTVTTKAGAAAIPLMLMLIGASMYPVPKMRHKFALGYLAMLRLLIMPAIYIFAISALPLAADVKSVAFVVALMPTAMSAAVLTRRYGGDPVFAAAAAMVTTLLSIATLPVWVAILDNFGLLAG